MTTLGDWEIILLVIIVVGLAYLVLQGMLGLVDGCLAAWREREYLQERLRADYCSLRETYNGVVEMLANENGPVNDDDLWLIQTALYDLRQARYARP
jgi:hypothetical protein